VHIYLLRHGETEWSSIGRKQGRGDSPLTPRGVRQVIACGDLLASRLDVNCPTRIISSTLGRAKHSAELLSSRMPNCVDSIETSDLLVEHDYGIWEGLTESEIECRYPGELAKRRRDHWSYEIPNGESYQLVSRRVAQWFGQIRQGSVVIAVSHDIVSRVLRGIYLGLPPSGVFGLTHPHTRIYELAGGKVHQLEADMHDA